jgi:hypothetical protein
MFFTKDFYGNLTPPSQIVYVLFLLSISTLTCKGVIMNVKSQVQDAASWYFSHVDPQCPNYENVQRFLRGPLIALTVNHVLPHLPTSNVASKPKADVEEKTSRSGGDWRDFLTDDPDAHGSVVGQFATEKAQEAYLRLSRRTQARMEAFLAGCALAAPNEMGNNLQKHADQQSSDLVTLQEGLSGFGISTSGNASTKGSQTAVLQQLDPQQGGCATSNP